MHLGTPEIIALVVIVLLLFGPKKLPELGRSIGQGIKEFRKSTKTALEDKDDEPETKPDKPA